MGEIATGVSEVDVAVVGGGMGGLVAAVAGLEDGARVAIVEKGPEPGGSLAISGGYVWTLPTFEAYLRHVPRGDPALGRVLVDDFETGLQWLEEHGVRLGPALDGLGPDRAGAGRRIVPDPVSGLVQPLVHLLRSSGGELLCDRQAVALEQDDRGRVCGVRWRGRETAGVVHARAVVVATGGFQGDRELMARHVSPWSDRAILRAGPASTGDGFRMATHAGAAASRALNAVYAHVMPLLSRPLDAGDYRPLTQFYVEECMLLNLDGQRFADESRGDALCGLELLRQREAAGFIVFDDARRRHVATQSFIPDLPGRDPVEALRSVGGTVIEADSAEALCSRLVGFRVPRAVALRTIREFDAAAAGDDPHALPVQRSHGLHRCDTRPFFAIPVVPGVTFTEGGVHIDPSARALDRNGHPVPGLFIAGVDAGNISNVGYAGGLSAALVTGLRAGVGAARA